MIPKTAKLQNEDKTKQSKILAVPDFARETSPVVDTGPIKIRVVPCCNEFVAVLRFSLDTTIALPDEKKFRNEGIVVGIGPGLPSAGSGTVNGRCPSQLVVGDVVMFQDRSVVTEVQSNTPPYKDKHIVVLSERNIICKLQPVPFEIIG